MKQLPEYLETRIDEGFLKDIGNFLMSFFGIDTWLYQQKYGLFTRNRYSGTNRLFGHPWGNFVNPKSRKNLLNSINKKYGNTPNKPTHKNSNGNTNNNINIADYIDFDTIFYMIKHVNNCKEYTPENSETTSLEWIMQNSSDKENQFVASAWFQKNIKNFSKSDEFILLKGNESEPYYTALDCVIRDGQVILPFNDEEEKNINQKDVYTTIYKEIIIPATYLAHNDIKGLEKFISVEQKAKDKTDNT